jgi:hypothetical protein
MSGMVDYPKVIDHLTDVIKELNCAPQAEPEEQSRGRSHEERQRDAVGVVKALLSELEQGGAGAGAAAAAENAAASDKFGALVMAMGSVGVNSGAGGLNGVQNQMNHASSVAKTEKRMQDERDAATARAAQIAARVTIRLGQKGTNYGFFSKSKTINIKVEDLEKEIYEHMEKNHWHPNNKPISKHFPRRLDGVQLTSVHGVPVRDADVSLHEWETLTGVCERRGIKVTDGQNLYISYGRSN